ncbi:hypothetical protein SAMN05428642_1011007 [Flaviramulus basaltis]|uniref:Uncharacterized protein n=1 Tax=Flaviramulus basaltis TaxID=369401 RepID=A0A1K2IDQ1_9FLAO|nr:hypothetical protein [Flaviramulus basaltis]SFZ90557.1 hypothetical protein SAMN05428642_1011007 [Flaviramulus basaltis]
MKNLFFTLTFVLIGALGFANNSVKKEITTNKELVNSLTNSLKTTNKLEIFGTCYIRITFYDENGNVLKQEL